MKRYSIFFQLLLLACSTLGQVTEIAFLGVNKTIIKEKLDNSSFITKIEEKVTQDGTAYYWCETRNTYVLAYNFDGNGKCFQFSIMDAPEHANTWRSIFNGEFTLVEPDLWKDERSSPTIYWRMVVRKEAVWTQASYKNH